MWCTHRSDRIAPDRIGNVPAETLIPAIEKRLSDGTATEFILLPLFFGERYVDGKDNPLLATEDWLLKLSQSSYCIVLKLART